METVIEEDEILYSEFLNGNMESLDKIYNRYKECLIQYSKSIVEQEEIAEEIVQDIFLNICANPEKYNPKYTLRSFLYMICHRKSLSYLKRTKRRKELNGLYINVQENFKQTDLSDELARKEDIAVIKSAIKFLKLEYRVVLELTEFQGLSTREASIILNKSENATKTLKCRAKSKLEEVIEKKFSDTAKSYKKNLLQIIIICICLLVISATGVYAIIKSFESVFKAVKTFTLDDLEKEVEMKEEYITREQAIEKITNYLNALGYNEEVKDICLFRDIKQCDDFWKYSDDNFDIRIDAYTGELIKFFYKSNIINYSNNIIDDDEVLMHLENEVDFNKIGIKDEPIELKFINESDINCKTIYYKSEDKIIRIIYSYYLNKITDIIVERKNFEENEILISKESAKNIISDYYNIKEIISIELDKVQVNYQVKYDFAPDVHIANSKQYRNAWKVKLRQVDNTIVESSVDATTGEIIEIDTKL